MKNISSKILVVLFLSGSVCTAFSFSERPNILWIIVEDTSCHFGYNGETLVQTPNVDKLAREGVVYTNVYVTGPVCSASRSAMITGMYQTTIGAHNHRSSRSTLKHSLPDGMKTIPELFKKAGYYTCNGDESFSRKGKEDYNFEYEHNKLYDGVDWSARAEGQPFFAQVQLRGGKLRNVDKWYEEVTEGLDPDILVSPEDVTLPPYYPDHPDFLYDWAVYLNSVQYTDIEVGIVLDRLKKENLLENTVIFFITDHGISQARGKQFLYDEGTRIPFIIWAPEMIRPAVKEDLINHIDMAATSLQLAGIEIPVYMEAKPLIGEDYEPRNFIVSARDRCDETVDHIRGLRTGNFKYIRNYLPLRPYLQPNKYKDHKPWMPTLKKLAEQGKLNAAQMLITADKRPPEELYDLSSDPFELHNLAGDPKFKKKLKRMRRTLNEWVDETGDRGMIPEAEAMYDENANPKGPDEILDKNIAIMKKWASEGK